MIAIVATQDNAIGTANELAMVQRAHAQTVEVQASHFVMISKPEAVLSVIELAAGQRQPRASGVTPKPGDGFLMSSGTSRDYTSKS